MQTHTQTSANGIPQRNKVRLDANIPLFLTLEFDPPQEPRAGRFGDQFMYWAQNAADGQAVTFFADPPVHDMIVASGARAGMTVAIEKHERRIGQQKHVAYNATVVQHPQAPAQGEAATMWGGKPIANAAPPAPAPRFAPPPPAPAAPAIRAASVPAPQAPAPVWESGNPMAVALQQAIEACQLASFDARTEDIRALAITIYIAHTGGKK